MRTKLFIVTFIFLSYNFSYSQVTMGVGFEKNNEKESIIAAPPYKDSENFIEYESYYHWRVPKNERASSSEFYKRYIGLQIYYPTYSNDYRIDETLIFKKTDEIILQEREDINDKYFTIINITDSFNKSDFFDEIEDNNKNNIFKGLLIEVEDNSNGEIIYIVEPSYFVKFILVPYFEKIKKDINENTFVATTDFSATKIPLTRINGSLYVDKNTEWKGELTISRKKDLRLDSSVPYDSDQDIKYMVILRDDTNTILMDLHEANSGRWHFNDVLLAKNNFEEQKQLTESEKNEELNRLIKKYGEKYGNLVNQKKLTIGMSKDMCSDILGITLNRKKYTNANNEIEVWEYIGVTKLYFKNGKLNEIINY